MDIICQRNKCTGCQACRIACPKQCISMQEDVNGNIYPIVDKAICIDCKKCQKVCPSINPPSLSQKPLIVYAGWAKDKEARKYSTSGGISYVLSKHFLESGHYFCGAVWTEEGAIHKVSSSLADIKLFQGSKYSHSDVKDCYKEIRKILISGNKVLFIGTPCQVAGLRSYLSFKYDNLFTVDIICHGVPSRRVLRDRIKYIEKENGKKVVEMRFRDKNPNQLHTCCKYIFDDGTFVMYKYSKDFFFRSFVDNYALRNNCFECDYSSLKRVSDMTIADFWGYQPKSMKFYNFELGVSIIMVNNSKGRELIDLIKDDIIYEERSYTECINQNMYRPQEKPSDYESYWKDYNDDKISKSEIQAKYLKNPTEINSTCKYEFRKFFNFILPKVVMDRIRQILKLIRKI